MSQKKANRPSTQNSQGLSISAHYSGPLPPAGQLEHYEKICPGSAKLLFDKFAEERTIIMEIGKNESNANIEFKSRMVKYNLFGNTLGQILSAIIYLSALASCIYLAINGHTAVASAIVIIPFAGIIRAMIGSRK